MLPLNSCPDDPQKFYVANLSTRWAQAFMAAIEYRFFNPANPKPNKLLDVWPVKFARALYFVVGVKNPLPYAEKVKQIALSMGLRVCEGVLTSIKSTERTCFPVIGPNVWTLENRQRPFFHKIPYLSKEQECEIIWQGKDPVSFQ